MHVIYRISILSFFVCHAKLADASLQLESAPGRRKTCETLFKIGSGRGPVTYTFKSKLLTGYTGKDSDVIACAPTGSGKTLTFSHGSQEMESILFEVRPVISFLNIFIAWKVIQFDTTLSSVHLPICFCDLM
jgi:hypothetical protein